MSDGGMVTSGTWLAASPGCDVGRKSQQAPPCPLDYVLSGDESVICVVKSTRLIWGEILNPTEFPLEVKFLKALLGGRQYQAGRVEKSISHVWKAGQVCC